MKNRTKTDAMLAALVAKWANVTAESETANLIKKIKLNSEKIEGAFSKIAKVINSGDLKEIKGRVEVLEESQDNLVLVLGGISEKTDINNKNIQILESNQDAILQYKDMAEELIVNFATSLPNNVSPTLNTAYPAPNGSDICVTSDNSVYIYAYDDSLNNDRGGYVECVCPSSYNYFYYRDPDASDAKIEVLGCISTTQSKESFIDSGYSFAFVAQDSAWFGAPVTNG